MKILLGILTILILAFCVVAMYCAIIVAGRSDEEYSNKDNNNGGDDDMFFKKQLCPKCAVGQRSYELDKHSDICPYIGCLKDGKCHFYEPIKSGSKKGVFNAIKNKRSVTPPPKNRALQAILRGLVGGCVTQIK